MIKKSRGTRRTFHWWDSSEVKRLVEIDDVMNVVFRYNSATTLDMSPDEFDSLIQFVYSELKKRRLYQKEVKSANS